METRVVEAGAHGQCVDPYSMGIEELEAHAQAGDAIYPFSEAYATAVEMTTHIVEDVSGSSFEARKCRKSLGLLEDFPSMRRFVGLAGLVSTRLPLAEGEERVVLDSGNPEHFPVAVEYLARVATHPREKDVSLRIKRAVLMAQIAVNSQKAETQILARVEA